MNENQGISRNTKESPWTSRKMSGNVQETSRNFPEISGMFPEKSWKCRGNVPNVPKMSCKFPGILLEISKNVPIFSRKILENFPEISREIPGNVLEMSWKCHGNVLEISREILRKFLRNVLEMSRKFPGLGNFPNKSGNPRNFPEISLQLITPSSQ